MWRRGLWGAGLLAGLALALPGCGGGSEGADTGASAPAQAQSTVSAESAPKPDRKRSQKESPHRQRANRQGATSNSSEAPPVKVSGGGSAQFKVNGGDNSVQEYGTEAGEGELREAAEVTHAYLVARYAGEWRRACSLLSAKIAEQLERLVEESAKRRGKGCAAALAAVAGSLPAGVRRQQAGVDAASLRRQGEQGFLIYTGPPGKSVYSMPLRREDGEWKVGGLGGNVLPGT